MPALQPGALSEPLLIEQGTKHMRPSGQAPGRWNSVPIWEMAPGRILFMGFLLLMQGDFLPT